MLRASGLRRVAQPGAPAPTVLRPHRTVPVTGPRLASGTRIGMSQSPISLLQRVAFYGTAAEASMRAPEQESMATSTSLRKHVNSFLKHVHPDLFHEEGDCERVNLDSLQKLHCFIDEVKQFENGASHGAIPRYLELKFYVKANPQLSYGEDLPPSISAKFTIPSDLFEMRDRTAQKRAIVGSAVRQVVDLLKQAGISIPASELTTPEPVQQSPLASATRKTMWVSDVATDMNDAFYDALRQYRSNIIVEERVAGTKQYERIIQRAELSSLFNPANVYFHPKLNVEQQRQGLRRLKGNLTRLGFEQWCDMPIFMTEDEWSAAAHRALVVPYNFTLREMRLYLMNELPRIQAERKQFQTALANATDLADYLIDNFPVAKISITSELHPSDAADIVRGLTAALKAVYESSEHDEELAIALENTHLILTRQVVDTEVRTRSDEFMVLLPRNFNVKELFDRIKDEFQSWSERGHSRTGATEKLHDSGMINAYTSAMSIPINALTVHPPEPFADAEAADKDPVRGDEVGLSEEEKQERQKTRTLKTLFGAYLSARTKSDTPFLGSWATSLLEAPAEDQHTTYELRALSSSLMPLSAFADIPDAPVHVLSQKKLAALPISAPEALANDPEVLGKFATLVEQLQNFAVVLRDVVPDMVAELPRSLHSLNEKMPADRGEAWAAATLEKAFDTDTHDLRQSEELAEGELELKQPVEDMDDERAREEEENAEEAAEAAREEGAEGADGEEEGAVEEVEDEAQPDEAADGMEDEAVDPVAATRDYPDPITLPFDLTETLGALQEITSVLPRETPMGGFYYQLFTALKNLELMETLARDVIAEDQIEKADGKEQDEKEPADLAGKEEENDEIAEEREAGKTAGGKKEDGDASAVVRTRRSIKLSTIDEPDVDELVSGKERDEDLDEEPEPEAASGLVEAEDGDELQEGPDGVDIAIPAEEDGLDEDDGLPSLEPENAMKIRRIQQAVSNSEVKHAFAETLRLAYARDSPQILQDSLAAVAKAHTDLQAAIEGKLTKSN